MSFVWMSLSENTHIIACERRVRKTHKKKKKRKRHLLFVEAHS